MLIRTEGGSSPFAEISGIAGTWFFWRTIFGICGLATVQRVINAVGLPVDSGQAADMVTASGIPALPLNSDIPPSDGQSPGGETGPTVENPGQYVE